MYGAILGDIMSQQHIRDNEEILYLVDKRSKFTDYTVMTIAIADALLLSIDEEELNLEDIKNVIMGSLFTWGNKEYKNTDYGDHFKKWLSQGVYLPIDGIDNSAAAVISVIPYLYSDFNKVVEVAKMVASITHSDAQSISNAAIVALAIYYAKDCPYKALIKNNLEFYIGCTFDEAEKFHNTVLESIVDFFESIDVESAINKAIAHDSDIKTRAVIAGSIAEAFYGIPKSSQNMCNRELTKEMLGVFDHFDLFTRRNFIKPDHPEYYEEIFISDLIEKEIKKFNAEDNKENFNQIMNLIYYGMYENLEINIPLMIENRNDALANSAIPDGDGDYLSIRIENKIFIVAFTSLDETTNESFPDIFLTDIKDFFENFIDGVFEEDGIIFNPHDEEKMFIRVLIILHSTMTIILQLHIL